MSPSEQLSHEATRTNGKRICVPFALDAGLIAPGLTGLSQRLGFIASRLAEQERIGAIQARHAGTFGFIEIPPRPETIALRQRLITGLLTEAEEVAAAIQQIVLAHQVDQMHTPVEA